MVLFLSAEPPNAILVFPAVFAVVFTLPLPTVIPFTKMSAGTSSFAEGAIVPMPTSPEVVMYTPSLSPSPDR